MFMDISACLYLEITKITKDMGCGFKGECGPEVDVDSNSTSQYKTCHWEIK